MHSHAHYLKKNHTVSSAMVLSEIFCDLVLSRKTFQGNKET